MKINNYLRGLSLSFIISILIKNNYFKESSYKNFLKTSIDCF